MLISILIKEIHADQPIIFFTADHLIEKIGKFNKLLNKNKKNLTKSNIFIFGIKPDTPSKEFGYLITKKNNKNLNKVTRFYEKPNYLKAKNIVKKGGYWNSGMFFMRKDSIINNFKKYNRKMYKNCLSTVNQSKLKNNVYYLNKKNFIKITAKSFDYTILEKAKDINAIKLDIPWFDLGSWKEILSMFNRKKIKYFNKKNIYIRPWGKYVNLYLGKNFLIKELSINSNGILSLQKHFHRSEHWLVTSGKPKITLKNKFIYKKPNETVFIPKGTIHRIQNPNKKIVKIMEAQLGSILKETDIVRYEDFYGRVN